VSELGILVGVRGRALLNAVTAIRKESRLKVGFISLFALAFWVGLFAAFREAFFYIAKAPGFENLLVGVVFSLFFLSLLIMLVFSNAVLIYGSLYRSNEVDFLLTLPLREETVFTYKYFETVFYSSWAFVYLAVPIIVAFGYNRGVPWYFYPAALVMFLVFVAIPAGLGSLISMLLVAFVPRSRFKVLAAVSIMVFLAAVLLAIKYVSLGAPRYNFGYSDLARLTGKVSFAQNAFLPSLWLTKGVLSLARAEPGRAIFYLAVILSNSLLFTVIAQSVSKALFWRSFSTSHSSAASRVARGRRMLPWCVDRVFFFLPGEIRLFLVKDIKTFLRDTTQWSQVLIFFGVLAIYFINIRSLRYDLRIDQARSAISLLNLAATCLVLSTFTSRFIFPLLSLEGKKFWVLGLAPIERKQILYGKFYFTLFGSLGISEFLLALSDWMLEFPLSMWLAHAVLVLVICSGVSAISVGLGARYPNLKEDNPAKIVAGFGGTLNLIVSMLYIVGMVAAIGIPYHISFAGREAHPEIYYRALVGYLGVSLLIGAGTSIFFLNLGRKQFESMEF
jgi:ABC-2 type transport system permease protein